jgi:mevalonate kinase
MPAISAAAPAKIILTGEHAVVYGRPAIAVPVEQVKARAAIQAEPLGRQGSIHIEAPEINLSADLAELPAQHPLRVTIENVLAALKVTTPPAFTLRINSTIPLSSGLGSGAAVSVAIIRAVATFLGKPLPAQQVSDLAYLTEKIYHGTPSGIDNSVVSFAQPVYFISGKPIQTFKIQHPFTIVIGDTGVCSSTAEMVGGVRARWEAEPATYEAIFDQIAGVTKEARQAIEHGRLVELGALLDENQGLLQRLGVSTAQLELLISAARQAGAAGAKLSGKGGGGHMIALTDPQNAPAISSALYSAGAARTIITQVS